MQTIRISGRCRNKSIWSGHAENGRIRSGFRLDEEFDNAMLSDPWLKAEYESVFATIDAILRSHLKN